jgi:UDPglucose 6-dehydrogenase
MLKRPVVIDGRNLYATDKMAALGFVYHSMGRQPTEETVPMDPPALTLSRSASVAS